MDRLGATPIVIGTADRSSAVSEEAPGAGQPTPRRGQVVTAMLLGLAGLVAAWSWLAAVSRWGPANRLDILTFKAGLGAEITRLLLKQGRGTGGHRHGAAMVSALYATPTYYAMTEQSRGAATDRPEEFLVFYVFEDVHLGQLSRTPLEVALQLDDGRQLVPVDRRVVRDSFHHRATVVRFSKIDERGHPVLRDDASSLTLITHDPTTHTQRTMQWALPLVYPVRPGEATSFSVTTLIALLAGLLAVLSPCLLQLTIYYTFALAGVGVTGPRLPDLAVSRGRVVRAALGFVAGYTAVFTLSGALAGLVGERLQSSGWLERWNRPVAIATGLGIVALGLWVGLKGGGPGVCRLPRAVRLGSAPGWLSRGKMAFLGAAFAVGCSTCFGGALFIALMVYVGTVGSPSLGALALLMFSLAMAVPYLIAAFFLSRALPTLSALGRFSTVAGWVCGVALIFFGVMLITDTFHVPSDWLYRLYLGLS